MNIKYTKESIKEHCIGKETISSVLRSMNLKSGSHKRLFRLIKEVLIEQGTYKGVHFLKGTTYTKKDDATYFSDDGTKKSTWSVRNNLFKRKLKEKECEVCKNKYWNGKEIPLEVHHVDGNKHNNLIDNLQILCPNCHYFTDTYKIKNIIKAE